MGLRRYIIVAFCVIVCLGATIVLVGGTRELLEHSGLRGRYWVGTEILDQSPVLDVVDLYPSRELLRRRADFLGHRSFVAEWDGFLVVPAAADYRFAVTADDMAALYVDGKRVASHESRWGTAVSLSRGLHHVHLRYVDGGGDQDLSLLWATATGPFVPIPALLLVPELRYPQEVRMRRLLTFINPIAPWTWWAILCLTLGQVIRHICRRLFPDATRPGLWWPKLALASIAALFATGLQWGLPDFGTWAPDEILPTDVHFAAESLFAGGWSSVYPPLHFGLLALMYLPFDAVAAAGLIDLNSLLTYSALATVGRLLSVGMGVGIVALTYAIARENFGRRAAAFAAAVITVTLPLTYYSKTANVDVPYVFWVALSLLFYLRCFQSRQAFNFYLLVLFASAAICTKDQAYGFFVMPGIVMLWQSVAHRGTPEPPPGVPRRETLLRMVAIGVAAFAFGFDLPFNWNGFMDHARAVGVGGASYQMYPRTPIGYVQVTRDAVIQLADMITWPLLLAVLCSIASAVYHKVRACLYLLLTALSYFIFFIAVVLYHYDRFYLGVAVVLSVVSGWWLDRWTRAGVPYRGFRLAACGVAIGYALSRCVALDYLMIHDSRYAVERWARSTMSPAGDIAGVGPYLPRASFLLWQPVAADVLEVERRAPSYVLVNGSHRMRTGVTSRRRQFYEAVSDGSMQYRIAIRYRTPVPFPLCFEERFQQVREHPFSNLTKINPAIELYGRGGTFEDGIGRAHVPEQSLRSSSSRTTRLASMLNCSFRTVGPAVDAVGTRWVPATIEMIVRD